MGGPSNSGSYGDAAGSYRETTSTYRVPQGPAVDRVGGVPSTLKGQAEALDRLENVCGELFAHLESGGVLRPTPPDTQTGQGSVAPAPAICSVAGEIQRGSVRVEVLRRQVEDVLKRLDI